ncbi:MAG: hypothetical protein R3E14_14480 [Erythrobacter sp.]
MSNKTTISRTSIHLAAAIVGCITLVGTWLAKLDVIGGAGATTMGILFVVSAVAMFVTRNADEYVVALWRAGANAAFLALLATYIFAPFAEGFYDGLSGGESHMDTPIDLAPTLAFSAFFLAHSWARLRGTF